MKCLKIAIVAGSLFMQLMPYSLLFAQSEAEYGPWKASSCYPGLEFCVKRGHYNQFAHAYYWYVKFRNKYQQPVSFDYTAVAGIVYTAKTDSREHIEAGATQKEDDIGFHFVNDEKSINVIIDHVRLGKDAGPYVNCAGYGN